MHRWTGTATEQHTPEHYRETPAVRTYQQIAQILAERDGTPVSPALVEDVCQAAEMRILQALIADPVLRELLRADAATADHATRPAKQSSMHSSDDTAAFREYAASLNPEVWSRS